MEKLVVPKGRFHPFTSRVDALLGIETLDESHRVVSDLIYRWLDHKDIVDVENLEIEGKIGTLISGHSFERFHLQNSFSESIVKNVNDNVMVTFQSSISPDAFKILNGKLNERVLLLKDMKDYTGPKIEYKRVHETDMVVVLSKTNKVRVTVDTDNEEVWKRAIKKDKKEDINFFCPHQQWDYRMSINYERDVPMPEKNSIVKEIRKKERISYKFDIWQIDISLVQSYPSDNFGKPKNSQCVQTFEVEVECDTKSLFEEKEKLKKNVKSKFKELTLEFLTIMRTLCDCCRVTETNRKKFLNTQPVQQQQPTERVLPKKKRVLENRNAFEEPQTKRQKTE